MKAVQLLGPETLQFTETYPEPPAPEPGEVTIRVGAVGICGSDLHLYKEGHIGNIACENAVVPGHEFMGRITAAAHESNPSDGPSLQVGQRVAVEPHLPCHHCEWCERGDVNLCPNHIFLGLPGADGALREKMNVAARNCFVIPDSISDAAGALLEPLGVALHALDLAKSPLGRKVAIIGCGPIGLLVLRLCRLAGVDSLVAIDPQPARRAVARRWGATQTIAGPVEANVASALESTNGRGFDLVFECAWTGPALSAATEIAAPGAQLLLVGIPADDTSSFPHAIARRKGLTFLFVRRMKQTYPRAIRLAAGPTPAVPLDELVSHHFPLNEAPAAFALNTNYGEAMLKAVIEP